MPAGGLAIFMSLSAAGTQAQGICHAPQERPPCAASSTLAPLTEPGIEPGVGNPVHLASGEKFLREIDLPAPADDAYPSFVRLYRTGRSQGGPLGTHWSSEYDITLQTRADGWRVRLADGRQIFFDARGHTSSRATGQIRVVTGTTPGERPQPRLQEDDGVQTAWQQADGTTLGFDQHGWLRSLQVPGRAPVSIARHALGPHAGLARRIDNGRGALELTYSLGEGPPRLLTMQTPRGTFRYEQEPVPGKPHQTRTTQVRRPDGMRRIYHHEPQHQGGHPDAITGVSLAAADGRQWRARSWSYDAAGRVTKATPGPHAQTHGTLYLSYTGENAAGTKARSRQAGAANQGDERNGEAHHGGPANQGEPTDQKEKTGQATAASQKGATKRIGGADPEGHGPAQEGAGAPQTRLRAGDAWAEISHDATNPGSITRVRSAACATCPVSELRATYDARARLRTAGDLSIRRYADGRIRQLRVARAGWPGLVLDQDPDGRRSRWSSALTGTTRLHRDASGRPDLVRYGDDGTLAIRYDAAGRPEAQSYARPNEPVVRTTLQWHGTRLRRLEHPSETEHRQFDASGRLHHRSIHRPHPAGALRYHEAFQHDSAGRLLRHDLPEGGALHYRWSADGRLAAITWQPASGTAQSVITSSDGIAGVRYGNGLQLHGRLEPGRSRTSLVLSDGPQLRWAEQRRTDPRGRVRHLLQALPEFDLLTQDAFTYDAADRLIGVGSTHFPDPVPSHTWLAWDDSGALRGRRTSSSKAGSSPRETGPPAPIVRGGDGLPTRVDGWSLRYGAQRRLSAVRLDMPDATPAPAAVPIRAATRTLDTTRTPDAAHTVRYTHNARGHTIRRSSAAGETERYYLENRLVGQWHRPPQPQAPSTPSAAFGISQRYIYAHDVPVGLLQTGADGRVTLYYIHADLLGRPVLVTDHQRRVRWAARYTALGRAVVLRAELDMPLRAPGQDEDPATGWHDNVFRTYLPARGQYLEPDPLGPLPGQQALGYAAQQPARYVDPSGLILLAFDGTRYAQGNQSNVWKLAQHYVDGPALYQAGPGNNRHLDWDAVTAASSGQIVRNQWQSLLAALHEAQSAPGATPIDLLGYSRGAALARDFANRIANQTRNGWFSYDDPTGESIGLCVDLRFLGLFDTVAQFGLLGAANAGYDLTIPDAWQWVAHAVALHEFRGAFPLVSATSGNPGNTVEAPFIGAHADIGGGMILDEDGHPVFAGDLSDVALNWMYWQAAAAQVPLRPLDAADRQVGSPLLHDERLPMTRILENSDRAIQDAHTRTLGLQRADARLGADQRAAFEAFIQRVESWQTAPGNAVATVDMRGYGAWLDEHLWLAGMRPAARDP